MLDGGKGSSPRPFSISQKEFDERWEKIFKKKEKDEYIKEEIKEDKKEKEKND